MEVWETIFLAIGGQIGLLAVIGWLSKSLVSQILEKDIEGFKALLKSESDSALQQLSHNLEKSTIEHQVRFSKLHEKRAEVIAELYSLLVQAYWDISSFTSPVELAGEADKKEKYVTAMNASADFYGYFEKHKIYLPEKLCSQVDGFAQEMRKKAIGFGVYVKYDDKAMPDSTYEKKHQKWIEAWEYFDKHAPEARSVLENELRNILGGDS